MARCFLPLAAAACRTAAARGGATAGGTTAVRLGAGVDRGRLGVGAEGRRSFGVAVLLKTKVETEGDWTGGRGGGRAISGVLLG